MVRTGAVYALGRIAQDSIERDHIAVMQVLCQFIRHSPYAASQGSLASEFDAEYGEYLRQKEDEPALNINDIDRSPFRECPDTVAAFEVLSGRTDHQRKWELEQDYDLTLEHSRLPWLPPKWIPVSIIKRDVIHMSCGKKSRPFMSCT